MNNLVMDNSAIYTFVDSYAVVRLSCNSINTYCIIVVVVIVVYYKVTNAYIIVVNACKNGRYALVMKIQV